MPDFNKKKERSLRFARRLFLTYSAVLLILLSLGLFFYSSSLNSLRKSYQERSQIQLKACMETMENSLQALQNLSQLILNDEDIRQLANMRAQETKTTAFYIQAARAQRRIAAYSSIDRLLPLSSFFVHMDNGYLLSPSFFTRMDDYFRWEGLQKNNYGAWQDLLYDQERYFRFLPFNKFKEGSDDLLYILPLSRYIYQPMDARICFLLSRKHFMQDFSNLFHESGASLFLAERSESSLTRFADEHAGQNLAKPERQQLEALSYTQDLVWLKDATGRYMVFRQHNQMDSRAYYLLIPESVLTAQLSPYRLLFLGLTGLSFILALVFLNFISRLHARPVAQLQARLHKTELESSALAKSLAYQSPLVQRSFLRKLLTGRLSSAEEERHIKQELALPDDRRNQYLVLYMVYEHLRQAEDRGHKSLRQIQLEAEHEVRQGLLRHFGPETLYFSPESGAYALLLCYSARLSYEEINADVRAHFEALNLDLQGLGLNLTGGLGCFNQLPENSWKSYEQALQACSFSSQDQPFILYSELRLENDRYFYPPQLSQSLEGYILQANTGQVQEFFKFLYKENLVKRAISYGQYRQLLTELQGGLGRVRQKFTEDAEAPELRRFDQKLAGRPSFRQLEDCAALLCRYSERLVQRKSDPAEEIRRYIQRNYKDPNLSLMSLSEQFKLSPSYISALFKEHSRENFSVYLEKVRMQAARKLLKRETLPISELYQELGYNNANSFRRAFKKHFGLTASEMRQKLLQEEA